MDLMAMWRLLWRHKIVTGVAVLLTGCLLVTTILVAPPAYRATSSVVLLSPPPPQEDPKTEVIDPVDQNPYVAFGDLSIVVDILRRVMSGTEVADRLVEAGVTGPFTVAANVDFLRGPIIDVTAEASSPDGARRANDRVKEVMIAELAAMQERQGTNPTFWITAETVVPATRASRLYTSVARRLIVVAALGGALVFAAALVADAVSRRRHSGAAMRQASKWTRDDEVQLRASSLVGKDVEAVAEPATQLR